MAPPYVRTFTGWAPPEREDGNPFTEARIMESATVDGIYALIETFVLTPVDADPEHPILRDFTTALAQLDPAWYKIVWADAAAATFPSSPVYFDGSAQVSDQTIRGPVDTTITSGRKAYIVYVGATRPSLYDTITYQKKAVDLIGASVKFSMRLLTSRVPFLDEVVARSVDPTTDPNGSNIAYDWTSNDVAVEGQYMGWWTFVLPGSSKQETSEFPIIVTDHGPGAGTMTGIVVDGAAAFMPITMNVLRTDDRFGDRWLQQKANAIKYRVTGDSVAPDLETTYHPLLIDYLSKRLALELIQPGIDYWQRQHRTVVTTGTNEVASYPDAINALEKLKEDLIDQLKQDWLDLLPLIPGMPQRHTMDFPVSSLGDPLTNPPLTTNPYIGLPLETGGFAVTDLVIFPWFR